MKLVLGVALLTLAAPAMALPGQSLADLLYIPDAGRFYGQTELSWTSVTTDIEVTGGEVEQNENTTLLSQRVGYGLSDQWRAQVSYFNQLKGRTSIEDNGNSDSEGPGNPDLAVLYRAMAQQSNDVTLDVFLSYAPDLIDSESDSSKSKSNYATGGASLTAGARLGHRLESKIEFLGELRLIMNGSAENEDTATKEKSKIDSYTEVALKGAVQFPLEEGVWVRGTSGLTTVGEREGRASDGDEVTAGASLTTTLTGSIVYAPIMDRLVLEAGVGLAGATDYMVKRGTSKEKYTSTSGSGVYLSALYQF